MCRIPPGCPEGEQVDQDMPRTRPPVRLLDQLPLRGQQIAFTVDVEQPGRRLDHVGFDGMAILPYEGDSRLIIKRDDAHGTR